MPQTKILLSTAVQYLSQSAAEANIRLHTEYATNAKKARNEATATERRFRVLPPPLTIKEIKMSFSANISRSDAPAGDLMLDFGKPPNFKGEISLAPSDSDRQPPRSFSGTRLAVQSEDEPEYEPEYEPAEFQGDEMGYVGYGDEPAYAYSENGDAPPVLPLCDDTDGSSDIHLCGDGNGDADEEIEHYYSDEHNDSEDSYHADDNACCPSCDENHSPTPLRRNQRPRRRL